jgi:YidC/Oxa1 family membrane protein insertase
MSDIRRTILMTLFFGSLLLLWDAWNRHEGHASLFSAAPAASSAAAAASGPAPGGVAEVPPSASAATPGASTTASLPGNAAVPVATGAPGAPSAAPAAAQTVTISTDVMRATLDSEGGSLIKLELIAPDVADVGSSKGERVEPVVLFDRSSSRYYVAQTGFVGAPGLPTHLQAMTVAPGPRTLATGQDELGVTFQATTPEGLQWTKTYTFKRGSYAVEVKEALRNGSGAAVSPQAYFQLVRDDGKLPDASGYYKTFMGPAIYTSTSKYKKIDFKKLDEGDAEYDHADDNGWVAMVQHYFVSAWLSPQPQKREFFARKLADHRYAVGMMFNLGTLAPGQSKALDTTLYAGPQREEVLEKLAPGFELVKDYGWLTILAKPLFWLLVKLHGFLGNWGWAIISLVLLLKIVFFGLNASAYRSMAKMKALNPRITELRERLKDKPQQMQQEMMKIYREEKVNPLGGCLPIVIQIPVFIALYWVLLSSVEMRHAPWIGWIHDLSAKDPYFILPLLMTCSSLVQTWLNPTPPDPIQAKMMWIMPIAFSFMFFFFPAGLVLYWLTNNILSITQQWLINRQLGQKK